jgi:hypothetical protein
MRVEMVDVYPRKSSYLLNGWCSRYVCCKNEILAKVVKSSGNLWKSQINSNYLICPVHLAISFSMQSRRQKNYLMIYLYLLVMDVAMWCHVSYWELVQVVLRSANPNARRKFLLRYLDHVVLTHVPPFYQSFALLWCPQNFTSVK